MSTNLFKKLIRFGVPRGLASAIDHDSNSLVDHQAEHDSLGNVVESHFNPDTGGSEIFSGGESLERRGGNVLRLRRVCTFYPTQDTSAYTGAVNGSATSAANTTIGTSGATPYGHGAWRLTTEAVNGSYAEVTIRDEYTNFIKTIAQIDPALPIVLVIAPHAVNGGSRIKLSLAATDATDASVSRLAGDMYIDKMLQTNETTAYQPVYALMYDMRSFSAANKFVDFPALLGRIRVQAYQEGTAGITDISILGVYQVQERPMVHIGFDDGLKSVYDYAFPIMQERGLVASVAVMGADVALTDATRETYTSLPLMIKPELDELVEAGWEMTVHGQAGPTGTYAQALATLTAQKAAVEALGDEYKKSSMFYVYPGGSGNWTADADGEPIGFKALRNAGFDVAGVTDGAPRIVSWSLGGLNTEPLFQDALDMPYYRSPRQTLYESSDYAARIKTFEHVIERIADSGGFVEFFTHNVVPQSVFPSGQPYVSDNAAWTGTVSTANDISVEAFTACMDILAWYRDMGLIEVVKMRDWYAGVPKATTRAAMAAHWTR